MSGVVFVTQRIDPAHPNLGAAVGLIRALAERVDRVDVLALAAVPGALPGNCRVHTFGARTQVLRGARFVAALAPCLAARPRAVIAHMSPVYAVLAAPLARPLRVPVILWFTHWRSSGMLRLAERLSTAVATVDRSSFPFTSRKLVAIGHGVDVAGLPCRPDPRDGEPLHVLALGRTSPAKGLEGIVGAVRTARAAGAAMELEIRGPAETPEEQEHRRRLLALAGDGVRVEEPVPRDGLPGVLARADLLVNAAATGSLDKSVYEACASCVPALASNPGFAGLLPPELLFERGDVEQLAARLEAFAACPAAERAALGHELRARVERDHSVSRWAERMLGLAER